MAVTLHATGVVMPDMLINVPGLEKPLATSAGMPEDILQGR